MGARFKSINFYVLLSLDFILVLAAHFLAYATRFEGSIPREQWDNLTSLLPYLGFIKLACFYYFHLYRGMWRYTSLPDIFNVFKASSVASLVMVAVLLFAHRFTGFSRSVFLLDWLYTIIFVAGLRVGIRLFYGGGWVNLPGVLKRRRKTKRHYVVLGAGEAGEKLIREIMNNPGSGMNMIAAFDDDPSKQGRMLHGVPIVGKISALPFWVQSSETQVQEALIAMPTLSGPGLRRVIEICEEANLPYRTIPSLSEIAEGRVSVKALRDVDFKDLLGRKPAVLDIPKIAGYLTDKVVLITGAGGSIGSELCRQAVRFKPRLLLLLDSSEFNLYNIQMELEHELGFKDYQPLLGTLRDREWTEWVLGQYRPSVIFHAAAYKHVPMLEANPWQAVYNNVVSTHNLVSLAVSRQVERLLIVSTDKAVRPTNVMGASKRLTEMIMQANRGRGTRLMAVRFGNVVGSAGSVIPLFRRQIERGGPVTVTHPDVVRYFMTIEEACQLILQAGSMGGDGEIFVLQMGQPVKIVDLAKDLIRLSGKEPGRDIEIKFIGMRPGEKLFEELITQDEGVVPTEHDQIMVLSGGDCRSEVIDDYIRRLVEAADEYNGDAIKNLFKQAVPEFKPDKKII